MPLLPVPAGPLCACPQPAHEHITVAPPPRHHRPISPRRAWLGLPRAVSPRLVATHIGATIPRAGARSLRSRSAPAVLREHPTRPVSAPFPQHSSRCCLPRACALPASESPTRAQLRPPFRRPSRRCRCRLVLPPPEPWSPPASERLCLASSSPSRCAPARPTLLPRLPRPCRCSAPVSAPLVRPRRGPLLRTSFSRTAAAAPPLPRGSPCGSSSVDTPLPCHSAVARPLSGSPRRSRRELLCSSVKKKKMKQG